MENSKDLIKWSLENKKLLNLEVIYYSGLKQYLPNLFDIGINIYLNSNKYHGRGSDFIEEIAYSKALSECFERLAIDLYNIESTNGIAAHIDLELAQKNAMNELIERDAFLCNFLLNANIDRLEESHIIPNELLLKRTEISFYKLSESIAGICVMATMVSHDGNLFTGFANSKSINEAILKSQIELLRDFSHKSNNIANDTMSIEEFNLKKSFTFFDHNKLIKSQDYSISFLNSFNKELKLRIEFDQEKEKFNFIQLSIQEIIPNCPLFVIRAENNLLQTLFCGPNSKEKINFQRLSKVSGRNIALENINKLPHPID